MTQQLPGGDLSRLRALNQATALRVIRGADPLTLSELAARTGLSRASTEDVVGDLVAAGWVAEAGPVAGAMGRPARRYRFRADAGHVLGIDIGGHHVRALVTDLDGRPRARAQRAVDPGADRATRLAAVDEVVAACLAQAALAARDIWAVGVATTGLVDAAGRVTLSVALPEWTGLDLAERVRRTFPVAVCVDNDARLAALAEQWQGVARYAKDVVYLLAGHRTGLGLVIDGKLHRGFGRAAGEIGALPAVGWQRAQHHLESFRPAAPATTPSATSASELVAQVFAAARDGDRAALGAVRRYVHDLAIGTAALVLTLDPQLVVLGGGFSRSGDLLLDPLRRELERQCLRTPEVLASTLGDECVVLGAVRLALDHVDATVLDPSAPVTARQ